MPNCLSQYATAGEARVARKLIRAALAEGWRVSVNDGEETTVRRSTREREILDAMCSTGEDIITIHLPIGGKSGGSFVLVYGNDDSGEELIADHSDNENCERLAAAAYATRAKADAIAHATPARLVVKRNADGGTYLARKDA